MGCRTVVFKAIPRYDHTCPRHADPARREGLMAVEVRTLSWWDTLRLQWHVAIPAFFLGLVAPNRGFLSWFARRGGGRGAMRLLAALRDKYRSEHLWCWFPVGRTLLVLAPESIEAVLRSDANAADPFLKKAALSRFVPDSLVISSGDEWRARRPFNEAALDLGRPHRHHDTFAEIAGREAAQLTGAGSRELRWSDFQTLGERISQQIIRGVGQVSPEMSAELARLAGRSNLLLREQPSFAAFYEHIERDLANANASGPVACLLGDSAALVEKGNTTATTRVPAQVGFWLFVLKDAVELHVARTLALIAVHPDVQQRVREEIRTAGGANGQAIDGLHYLEACIMEQLRLWTPVPLLMRRAMHSFTLREAIPVEAGRQLLIHAGFHHRDPRIFGAHADRFAPDSVVGGGGPDVYVFSAHRQGCAGRSLVMFILKATLAALLRDSHFELAAPAIEPSRIPYLYDHFNLRLRTISRK
jgi:cytochrome P450